MLGRNAPPRSQKFLRLGISVILLLTAAAPQRAAAQEAPIERVDMAAPLGGMAPAIGSAVAAPALRGALAGGAPSLSAPAINTDAVAARMPAPGAAAARSAPEMIAAPAASAAIPTEQEYVHGSRADATAGPAPHAAAASRRTAAVQPTAYPVAAARADALSAEAANDGARKSFSALIGERLASGRGRAVAIFPVVLAFGFHPGVHAVLQPSLAHWQALSQAGYVAGNAGAAIFPLIQIHQAFRGKSTPRNRAIIGAAASLALGLISAPILHKSLWGIQNVFGGLTLLAPLLIGRFAGRARGNGLKETALVAAGALAVGAAAYYAVAAALPGLLASAFSAAAVAKIALVVQTATSAMFLWMFLPDVVQALRGKAAGGFSTGFNLMFLLSSLGSMVWALPSAWIFHDAHQETYRMIFAVNAIYALASFLSFLFARREATPRATNQRDPS